MGGSDPDQQPNESPRASSANPERWVDEHGDCLYRYALVRVRGAEVAEDLVQETLLAAVRSREKFGGRSFGAKLARRHPEKQNSRLLPQAWPGRGCKRLSFERGGESRPHSHRQRLACRRSSAGPSELKSDSGDATVRLLSAWEAKSRSFPDRDRSGLKR
jgi:Sigma-70 region 2